MNPSRWVIAFIAAIIVLAGLQWWMNSRQTDPLMSANPYSTALPTTGDAAPVPTTNSDQTAPSASVTSKNFMHIVTIQTTKGAIVFETYDADAPKTVQNFITLADKGFYNGLIFHRVIDGFMIQGGDPTGTGTGGPGYQFADELDPATPSYQAGYVRGTVAMANSGPNTNGSQFFIVQADTPLPHSYTIFGKVISGMDVVDAIATSKTDGNDRPLQDIKMTTVTVAAK